MRAEDQYHVGIVVPDLDLAKKEWAAVASYTWGIEISAVTTVQLPIGTIPLPMRLVYSTSVPRVELVQQIPGTMWELSPGQGSTTLDSGRMTSPGRRESMYHLRAREGIMPSRVAGGGPREPTPTELLDGLYESGPSNLAEPYD